MDDFSELNSQQFQFNIAYYQCRMLARTVRKLGGIYVDKSGTGTSMNVPMSYSLKINNGELEFVVKFLPEVIDPYDGGTFSKEGEMSFVSKPGDDDRVCDTLERTIEGIGARSFVLFSNLMAAVILPIVKSKEAQE